MRKNKPHYSPKLKAEVVLEVLSGLKSPAQITIERDIHVTSINGWIRETRKQLSAIFKGEIQQPEQRQQEEIERLHQKIGQLTVEPDFLKKASGRWK
jgi:transposase